MEDKEEAVYFSSFISRRRRRRRRRRSNEAEPGNLFLLRRNQRGCQTAGSGCSDDGNGTGTTTAGAPKNELG